MRILRRRWLMVSGAVAALAVAALITLATRLPVSSGALRMRVIAALADRLDAEVEMVDLTFHVYPRFRATGEGLTVRFHPRADRPPLIAVRRFTVDADLVGLWQRRVARVNLEGLAINIPPGEPEPADQDPVSAAPTGAVGAHAPEHAEATDVPGGPGDRWAIDHLQADEATLTILRHEPGKAPRTWYLHELRMRDVGLGSPMPFESFLTNAVPPGQIRTTGAFGPWMRADPGTTPLAGAFTFDNADLSVFSGISGMLSAKGTFGGTLQRIVVRGETTTPDFMVNISGHPVPLRTTYDAVVNGTNGNTTLDPVNAVVLDTAITARGGVYEVPGVKGRVVQLDVSITDGRLEDVMRMAVRTPRPPMTGALGLTTSMTIPPGPADVVDKLRLDGRFAVNGGRFTDREVQKKINNLSRRARGQAPAAAPADRVASDFAGRFRLESGRLSLTSLTFGIPGAVVQMNGTYALRPETLSFAGSLYMDAKLSDTVSGFRSLLLKAADPLFRKDGRTRIPLKVSGTRDDPQFGLDVKRVFTR